MVWWAVVGGLVVAFQVYAGLTSVNRVGAGTFVGLTIDGNPGTHHIALRGPLWMVSTALLSGQSLAADDQPLRQRE
jgi:hypothetical protein